jgi:AbiV family abortive infection protein
MKNARELIQESKILLNHGHHARAFCLAFTAYEEIGKGQVVADYIMDSDFTVSVPGQQHP